MAGLLEDHRRSPELMVPERGRRPWLPEEGTSEPEGDSWERKSLWTCLPSTSFAFWKICPGALPLAHSLQDQYFLIACVILAKRGSVPGCP